jgi:class 3 adenylate cyclase/tetratricopeptide (TPR) repeat protein
VICSSCGATNDAGRKFCLECGTPLAVACGTCGAANPPAAKFCGECGARLGEWQPTGANSTSGRPEASQAAGGAVAERRMVTVLFADLVGFTALAEHRDAEDVRDLLSRYFDLARGIVERHGGTVEKFIGDAVMAVWGTPTSHEDDAERAVRTALELVANVRGLGPTIHARAGVLTGEAAVTIGAVGEGMVAGDMVNTASRLQSVAPEGSVLVGETTMHAASRAIAFEQVGDQLLKGKTAPVPAWRALRVVAERGGRGRAEGLEAPFVGRDDELSLLKDLYHATARDRRVRLVSVTGQGGIGKSRLAWEFLKYIDGLVETVYWHEGRSPSYGSGITFWALGEMVRERAHLAETDDEATTRARIAETVGQWLPDERERRWVEAALLALLGVGEAPPGGQDQLFPAWRTFFERIAVDAPVVMVFEDLQWADSGLLAFIDHLSEWSRGVPIYVLALARPEFLEARSDWGAGKRNFTSLALDPLTADAMRELLAGLVPGLPDDAASRIIARADGVPLYAVEIVRMLVAQGSLELAGDAYRPVGDLADLAVPETLHSLIAARLDALEPADRALLQAAAVLGQSFTVDGLAAVASLDVAEVERRLTSLTRRELVIRDMDPRSTERGQFAFVQSLVREVAYSTLSRKDRKARHLAAARHFETLIDQELAGALAAHYLAAYRNASDGAEADALAAQARVSLRAAGDRAVALGAQEQALRFYRDALEVTSEPAERAVLLERAGQAASATSLNEEADRLLSEAVALLRAAGDRSSTARVISLQVAALGHAYRFDAALAVAKPASEEFADLGDDPGQASLLGQLARFEMLRQTDLPGAIAIADRALPIADRLDRVDLVADILVTRGTALISVGRAHEGLGSLETALRLAERHGLIATEVRARTNLGGPLCDRDPRAAFEVSRVGLELARRAGNGLWISMLIGNASIAAADIGEWAWAVAELDATLERATAEEERITLLGFKAEYMVEQGQDAVAELDTCDAWYRARVADEPFLQAALEYGAAIRAVARHDLGGSSRHLIENGRLDPYNAVSAFGDATFRALLARDTTLAREALAALTATGTNATIGRLAMRLGSAGIDALEGQTDAARSGLLAVYAEYADRGVVRKQALTGLVMATLLGDEEPAVRDAIAESRRLFERMGAGLWLAQLDAVLGQRTTAAPAGA